MYKLGLMIKGVVVFLLVMTSHQYMAQPIGNITSEYFAVLPFWESPYTPFKGAYPISEEEAEKRIHLQLDMDDQDRVVMAHVKLGNYYKDFEGFFGNLYINAPITRVIYEGNGERHMFYDRFNNRISVQGEIHSKIYTKDDLGRNTSLRFSDEEGNATVDQFGTAVYDWIHQPDGSIIEERRNPEGDIIPLRGVFQFLRTRMVPGIDGYFKELHNIDEDGNLVNAECGAAVLRYFYDGWGRFLRWEVYDKDGNRAIGPSHTAGEQNTFYQYDLKDIIFFDTLGSATLHWSGAERWHFDVDEYGNRIGLTYRDRNDHPMNANRGYAQIKWKWSDDGRFLQSQSYFDQSRKKTIHAQQGIHEVKHSRDHEGLLVETIYLDMAGMVTNRTDNRVAKVTYKYDDKNKLTGIRSFNADNQEIK